MQDVFVFVCVYDPKQDLKVYSHGEGSRILTCPEGHMNVCSKYHGNPSSSCWEISVWTKVAQPDDRPVSTIPRAMLQMWVKTIQMSRNKLIVQKTYQLNSSSGWTVCHKNYCLTYTFVGTITLNLIGITCWGVTVSLCSWCKPLDDSKSLNTELLLSPEIISLWDVE